MIKKIIDKLIVPLAKVYFFIKYKNIWKIKEAINGVQQQSLTFKILLAVYEEYLAKQGSWIGHTAQFMGIPCLPHGLAGIFISAEAQLGSNVVIFQQVTIGSNTLKDSRNIGAPKIGDNVYIGSGAKIIGNINIGNNCRIGANAVVYKDLPPNSVAVSSSTRIIPKHKLNNKFYTVRNKKLVYYHDGNFIEDEIES